MKPQIPICLIACLLNCAGTAVFGEEVSLTWATTFGHRPNPLFESGTPAILSDTNGSTRIIGTCHQSLGTFVFGTNSFNATVDNGQQSGDIYVGHLDAHGKPISAKLLPRTGFMTFDPPVAAIGHRGNLAFGTHVYTSGSLNLSVAGLPLSDGTRTLLAKLDSADEVVWAKLIEGGFSGFNVSALTIGPDEEVIVAGSFRGEKNIDGVVIDANPDPAMFVAKFSSAGDLLWVRTASGAEPPGAYRSDTADGVAIDSAGNVLIAGTVVNGASFEGQTVSTVGDYDVFVARYTPDGTLDWVFTSDADRFQGLRVTRDNRPILLDVSLTSSGAAQLRLTILDNSGHPTLTLPAVLTEEGSVPWIPFVGMEVDEANNLLLVASVFGSATLRFSNEILSLGADEQRLLFAGSLRLDGTWNWLRPVTHSVQCCDTERYFLPGSYSWPEMRGFTVWQGALRFAGIYLWPEPLPMADGSLPASARSDSQFFVAELVTKTPPPMLTVSFSNTLLRLAWPSAFTNFVLQSATTLANGGDWQDSNLIPVVANGQKTATTTAPNSPQAFFRLRSN